MASKEKGAAAVTTQTDPDRKKPNVALPIEPSPWAQAKKSGGRASGDLTVPILGVDPVIECKARKDGFREISAWLQSRDVLIVKSDRRDALAMLPLRLAVEIALAAGKSKLNSQFLEATNLAKNGRPRMHAGQPIAYLAELKPRT